MKPLIKSDGGESSSSSDSTSKANDDISTKDDLTTEADSPATPATTTEASDGKDASASIELDANFLEQYVRRFPYQPSAWFQLAILAANQNENDKALDYLSKAIETGWSYCGSTEESRGISEAQAGQPIFKRCYWRSSSAARLD